MRSGSFHIGKGLVVPCVEVHDNMTINTACNFLENFISDRPFSVHALLTDNGAQFTYKLLAEHLQPKNKPHPFDMICQESSIEHRLTKLRHLGQTGSLKL